MRATFLRAFAILSLALAGAGVLMPPAQAQETVQSGAAFDALVARAKAKMLIDPAQSLESAKAAEVTARHRTGQHRTISLATAMWLQGEAYVRLNDSAHAAPLINRALVLISGVVPTTKLNGDLLLSKGGVQTSTADVAGALSSYQQAHKIYQEIGDTRSRSIALISIGLLYQEAEDYENALKYYGQALELVGGDSQLLYVIHNNRANALKELGRSVAAQNEFRTTLGIARTLNSPQLKAQTLRNMARGQLAAGQVAEADRTIALGLAASQGGAAASAHDHFLVLAAWSARLHGRLPDAERLIRRAFVNVGTDTPTLDLREGHQIAYDIFKQRGDDAQALLHLEALKGLDDKTSKLAASANTSLAAARFDFANQELNIEKLKRMQLQRNIIDAKLRARNQQTIFAGVAIATVIIVALLAFGLVTIRRSRNEVRAANVDLASTNAALAKALAAKTEFLATTSHEIRTPLNGILGMTQVMLADRTLSEILRDRIGVVHSAGETMCALVDDILDVAKMETGNLTLEAVPFDLKATLRDVSRLWDEQARAKGLAFVLDLAECPEYVTGDAARLRQIIFNLLSNALKFTAHGTVTVRASASDTILSVAVSDSGIGIPVDKLGIIFESFRQGDAGTTRRFGGTGLGLAICRNLAHAMEGDLSVTSTPDHGSTFTLELPLRLAAAPQALVSAPNLPDALLILDRNPISRSMLRAVLEARAGSIVFASSVEEATARIAEGGIARLLIDDGTLKAAGNVDAALAALGASGVTSALLWPRPDAADQARFAAAGIDQLIAKPIAGVALAAVLFDRRGDDHDNASQHVPQAA